MLGGRPAISPPSTKVASGLKSCSVALACFLETATLSPPIYSAASVRCLTRLQIHFGALLQVAPDLSDDRLGRREIARRQQRKDPLAVAQETIHLAVGADVIGPGVGAGVRRHDQALIDGDGNAVGHALKQILPLPRQVNGAVHSAAAGAIRACPPARAGVRAAARVLTRRRHHLHLCALRPQALAVRIQPGNPGEPS